MDIGAGGGMVGLLGMIFVGHEESLCLIHQHSNHIVVMPSY